VLPPRPLLALCVLLVGLLSWSVAARPAPSVALADTAQWEGQTVRVEGWVAESREGRLVLVDGGHRIQVDARLAGQRPGIGDRVEATGRLTRWQGFLRLELDEADGLRRLEGPEPLHPSWHDLAREPERWKGTLLGLKGTVRDGLLVGEGASLALGDGQWPTAGPVLAIGLLRHDPACVCHRLDAREVRAWSP
jgi:hypothetical protein